MEGVCSEDNEIYMEFSPDAIHKVRYKSYRFYLKHKVFSSSQNQEIKQ